MANLLITGSSGGIGRHLVRHLSNSHRITSVSRLPKADDASENPVNAELVCDLVAEIPRWPSSPNGPPALAPISPPLKIDWIIHLATTYDPERDLAMLDNLCSFAKENDIENFLFVSSWVVHFPKRLIPASYIRMKRECEKRILESGLRNARIVRPSVVLGEGLSWTRILMRLAPIWWLIPPAFTRSFVSIESLCECIGNVIEGRTESTVVTLLGERTPLAEKARLSARAENEHGESASWASLWPRWLIAAMAVAAAAGSMAAYSATSPLLIAGIVFSLVIFIRHVLPWVLSWLSDYFAGFTACGFEPDNVQDVVALCHRENENIQIRGYDNARLYFRRPNSPRHTTIILRRLDKVDELDIEGERVRVQSGAHFGGLLPFLDSHGLWLENYPNYHFISVGACIASAVHGSNLEKPFLADLIESITFYDRKSDSIKTVSKERSDFSDLMFPPENSLRRVILSAEIRLCTRQHYELTTTLVPVSALNVREISRPSSRSGEHYEIRINTPRSTHAQLQSYRQVAIDSAAQDKTARSAGLLEIKADPIGRQWNLLQRNPLTSYVTSFVSGFFINYEWFFTPEAFAEFWDEIVRDRARYPLYKLLVRYNRSSPDLVETPFHGTVSVDVTIFNTKGMLSLSSDLYRRYQPLEHLGKFSIRRHIQ